MILFDARIEIPAGAVAPDAWQEDYRISLPLGHVISRDKRGHPASYVDDFAWDLTAYHPRGTRSILHFFYWVQGSRIKWISVRPSDITPEREARIRELQFLMTRQMYFGDGLLNAPDTLYIKLNQLYRLARFAEQHACSVRSVLEQQALLDAFSATVPAYESAKWMGWLKVLGQLDSGTELGFDLAPMKKWKELSDRAKESRSSKRQHAFLPTGIYSAVINNLTTELDDIEAHQDRLLAACGEASTEYAIAKANQTTNTIAIGEAVIERHGLGDYLNRRGLGSDLPGLSGAITEIFLICKLQIHVFSGMRHQEARHLPYHCIETVKGAHGRKHCLIVGITTKLEGSRRRRTRWVTTDGDGFRAIRMAQRFAAVIYQILGVAPKTDEGSKDDYPLFPSTDYLPWDQRHGLRTEMVFPAQLPLNRAKDSLVARLCPVIEESDIAELEEVDPFRAWREEPEFAIGERWSLTPHQLRRSLALYANGSGLVRISSLRRQLQHLTKEMSLYYGRGSTFCKNFIEEDPKGFKKHIAMEWQDGNNEAQALAFVREVLNSREPLFGGAGNFYQRQRTRGEVVSRNEVEKQVKAGLLSYKDGPLGGCTNPNPCKSAKGLSLIDTVCATDNCNHLVGKHSTIIQTIKFMRASMAHIAPDSITYDMEKEELAALERVELTWRPQNCHIAASTGAEHA
jgi:hypothetical protein